MSRMMVVAARELRERWLLLPAGLVLGFVPLVLPAFGVSPEGTPLVGVFLSLLLGLVAALVAGASMLARDALDGRLGFLFSRPVPWPAIWGGKWLAAMVLVAGSTGLAALPWVVVHAPARHGTSWREALLAPQGSLFFLLLLVLGIGLANFNATAFRSRSAWVILDLGLLLLALWLAWRWVAPLYLMILGLHPYSAWAHLAFLGVPALALLGGSAAQVGTGRTDLRRAHQAMSLTFWGVILAALVLAGLRLAWARAATPADLTQYVHGAHDPAGRWLYLEGLSRRGGGARFLIDIEGGRYVALGLERPWDSRAMGMTFAADGQSGVIPMWEEKQSAIVSVELEPEPRFNEVELESSPPSGFGARLALSPSGAHVLLAHENGASLFAVATGRRIATTTVPPGWRPAAVRFAGASMGRVWLLPSVGRPDPPGTEMRILEISLDGEHRTTPVPLAAPVDPVRAWPHLVHPDTSGRRLLTRDGGLRLRDGETGALLATLVGDLSGSPAVYSAGPSPVGMFLADGRIVVAEPVEVHTVLHVFDAQGEPLDDITLDHIPAGLAVGPEVAPGRVAIRFGYALTGPETRSSAETVVVDLDTRRVVETLPDRQPLGGFWLDTPAHAPGAAAPTLHLLVTPEASVVRRDFASGDERVVAGPGARPGERITPADLGPEW